MKRLYSCALVALVVLPATASAQDEPWNRYTLDGLGGVFIEISANDVCQGAGVTASAFEASTSLKLIEAEVGVLTEAEMLENPAHPELYVTLECAAGPGTSMAYSVGLWVRQAAQMLRDSQISLPEAVTWHAAQIGVTEAAAAPEALETALTAKLDHFIEAWTAANADEGGA